MELKRNSCGVRHRENRLFSLVVVIVVLVISAVIVNSAFKSDNTEDTLQLVAIIHRHGLRTLVQEEAYKTDPYGDVAKYWPLGYGQLTLEGKKQLFNLGKNLRNLYGSFVPKFTVQSTRILSSDKERCIMSVASLLAGLFPPKEEERIVENLQWQPIPIHSIPLNLDRKIAMLEPCPKYNSELNEIMKQLIQNTTEEHKAVFKHLSENMDNPNVSYQEAFYLNMLLLIQDLRHFELPEWTKKVYPEPLGEISIYGMKRLTYTTTMKKLKAGPLLTEILDNFDMKRNGTNPDMKMLIYSAHDLTLLAFLRALSFPVDFIPYFGSAVLLELHSKGGDYSVKLSYLNDTTQTEPHQLDIPNCGLSCSLDKFLDVTSEVRTHNWTAECQSM